MAIEQSSSQAAISKDFLHWASQAVRDTESNEAILRSAISRSYYAVYLTVRDKLFGPDGSRLTGSLRKQLERKFKIDKRRNRSPGSHQLVIFAITDADAKKSPSIKPKALADQVDQLREARTKADYFFTADNLSNLPYETWRDYADESVALASQLLPLAERLSEYEVSP